MSPGATRGIQTLLALLCVGGWLFLWLGPSGAATAIELPEIRTELGDDRSQIARFDARKWREACQTAGLPEPPDLNGGDPVPIRALFDAVESYADQGDAASLGTIGEIYLAIEHPQAAIACFAAAAEIEPETFRWRYFLGAMLQTEGFPIAATRELTKARTLDSSYSVTGARLATLALEGGDLEKAQEEFRAYAAAVPGSTLGPIGLGRVALAKDDHQEALVHFERALQIQPYDFLAHRFAGRTLAAMGMTAPARNAMRTAEQLPKYSGWLGFDPYMQEAHKTANTPAHWVNEMRNYRVRGDAAGFLRTAATYLERKPADTDVMGMVAEIYIGQRQFDQAQLILEQALAIKPTSSPLLTAASKLDIARGDYGTAIRNARRAAALDPRFPTAQEVLGRALFLAGETEQAIAAMLRALKLDPAASAARMTLAIMYQDAGRIEEARAQLETLLERDPSNEEARRRLEGLTG